MFKELGLKKHIDRFWTGWGNDLRRSPPSWPQTNILYRARYLTGQGEFGPRVPKVEYSCQDFYRAQDIWRQMPDDLHRFTFVFYAQPWPWKRKCAELGVSKYRFYTLRDQVYEFTEARL